MIDELTQVALTEDLPEHGLKAGDVGTIVLVHKQPAGYEVEFVAYDEETIAVTSVYAAQVRLLGHREIPHARALA